MAGKKINLIDQLKKYFGFDTFKGNQEAIIENLLAGNDTFVLMPNRWWKIFVLPTAVLVDGGHGYRDFSSDCLDEESGRCDA